MTRSVAVSRFKAECLALLEDVRTSGEELVVTKRGVPLARVLPPATAPDLRGSVRYLVSDEELLMPIDARWDADQA